MANYKLSNHAKEDLIRIHHYGITTFGEAQADRYIARFFDFFDVIALKPYTFESVDNIKPGYRRCVCGFDGIFYRINNDVVEIMAIIVCQNINLILKE